MPTNRKTNVPRQSQKVAKAKTSTAKNPRGKLVRGKKRTPTAIGKTTRATKKGTRVNRKTVPKRIAKRVGRK